MVSVGNLSPQEALESELLNKVNTTNYKIHNCSNFSQIL